MKKFILTVLLAVSAAFSGFADGTNSIYGSLSSGYENAFVYNGVSTVGTSVYADLNAGHSFKYFDAYAGVRGSVAGARANQSLYRAGIAEHFDFSESWSIRVDQTVYRNQLSAGLPSSTDVQARATLENPIATPFVRYSYNIDSKEHGVGIGVSRPTSVSRFITLTPSVEYLKFTHSDGVYASARLSTKTWILTPYIEVGYLKNNVENFSNFNFAQFRTGGQVVYNGGVSLSF